MGGKADTGLGERDDEEDDEEDDIGHSRGFMSWRPRQKAVTCSVLCAEMRLNHGMSVCASFQGVKRGCESWEKKIRK